MNATIQNPAGTIPVADEQNGELIRHMRNVLAVIRALIRHAPEDGEPPDKYRFDLQGRVDAFTRIQARLLRDLGRGSDLEDLVREQLMTFGKGGKNQLTVRGPSVRIDAQSAGLFAILVHELALGAADDRSAPSIEWCVVPDGQGLDLQWSDTAEGHRDLEWIARAVSYQLNGTLLVDSESDRWRCTVRLPSAHLFARADRDASFPAAADSANE